MSLDRSTPRTLQRVYSALLTILLLGALTLSATLPASEGGAIDGPVPASDWPWLPAPSYGVQTFLWWNHDTAERDLQLVKDMGFGWIKQGFGWRDIEDIRKGHYNWYFADWIVSHAEEAGLKVLARIDRQPFWSQRPGEGLYPNGPPADLNDLQDFCYALADRYRGRIQAYQVWNEPNLGREWGDKAPNAAEYVELLRACYIGIKMADPDAVVVSAGLAPTGVDSPASIPDDRFLQEMYAAGAGAYFDVLGLNAPGYKAPPEVSPDEAADPDLPWGGHRTFAFRHVEDMRAIMVANGDVEKQVAILEMGWTTDPRPDSPYHWHSVTEAQQADYLVRAYQYALENWPWVGLMCTAYIAKYDWTEADEQYWWAITYPDYPQTKVRPAYKALKAMPKASRTSN